MDTDELNEFKTHHATSTPSVSCPHASVFEACKELQKVLLFETMSYNISALLELVEHNWNKQGKAHIYPIKLKENQVGDL
jgi:hypothetical protein